LNTLKTLFIITLSLVALNINAEESTQRTSSAVPVVNMQLPPALQLRMGVESLLVYMHKDPKPGPYAITRFLNEEIAPFFDFEHMARSSAGRYYYRFTAEQQQGMAQEMQSIFLTRLAQRLVGFSNQEIRYLPSRISSSGKEASTSLVISNFGNYPSRIDFRLHLADNGWTIIDIAANGQSAVVYYRQQLMRKLMGYQRRW